MRGSWLFPVVADTGTIAPSAPVVAFLKRRKMRLTPPMFAPQTAIALPAPSIPTVGEKTSTPACEIVAFVVNAPFGRRSRRCRREFTPSLSCHTIADALAALVAIDGGPAGTSLIGTRVPIVPSGSRVLRSSAPPASR